MDGLDTRSTGEVGPRLELGPCFMDVVALGLHYGARISLDQEDPRSQTRDLGHPSDFLRRYSLDCRSGPVLSLPTAFDVDSVSPLNTFLSTAPEVF
jgi:hypothetical protein